LRAELEQVYRQHRQALFSLALTITRCSGMAEDAVHEAFVRLCQKTDRPQESLAAYVFAAVRNSAIDCRRRHNRHSSLTEHVFAGIGEAGNSERSSDVGPDRLEQLRTRLEELEEPAREIIVMKIFGGLTFDEIGRVTSTPGATVATRYRRALLKLEEQLRRD
jgi:RNA polymerase sigma factor (sigma-70 family)